MDKQTLIADATAIVRMADEWHRGARVEQIDPVDAERQAGADALALLRRLIPIEVRSMNLETRLRQLEATCG